MLGGSWKIGTLSGIEIKIHAVFALWIAYRVFTAGGDYTWELIFQFMLFGSVFLHEMGHCYGARWVGGDAKEVILWPLGGLAMLKYPPSAWAEFVSTVAGPAVNLLLALLSLAVLVPTGWLQFDGPLSWTFTQTLPANSLKWLFILNMGLFLFNVLPAYPMDGGRIFRSMMWPVLGWRTATIIATVTALVFGVGFAGLGILGGANGIILTLIGVMVVMASWGELQKARRFRALPPVKKDDDSMPHERR